MRIRSIKPEFWSSDDIAALSWDERLLFIGLWSYVADSGVGRDNDKLIAADLFPLEDDPLETLATVSRGLASLSDAGLITRYRVGDKRFLYITAWADHQRIDKPTRSNYPPPTCEDAVFATPSREASEPSTPGSRDLGTKGTGDQGSKGLSAADAAGEPDRFDEFWDTYDKKTGRKLSQEKWKAALKKPGVTADLLITSAASYVAYQRREGNHPKFTKDPIRWLTGEMWNDERPGRVRSITRPHVSQIEQPPPNLSDAEMSQWLRDQREKRGA